MAGIISDWPWIITPDYVNVVTITEGRYFPVHSPDKIWCRRDFPGPVGGYIEPSELPLAAAQRELHEETGFEARNGSIWDVIGSIAIAAQVSVIYGWPVKP